MVREIGACTPGRFELAWAKEKSAASPNKAKAANPRFSAIPASTALPQPSCEYGDRRKELAYVHWVHRLWLACHVDKSDPSHTARLGMKHEKVVNVQLPSATLWLPREEPPLNLLKLF